MDELRECVKRYPYSGPLRMMLAKASELAQDMERRDDLLRAGAHVSSRRALFAYLMGPALVAEARAVPRLRWSAWRRCEKRSWSTWCGTTKATHH